MNPQDIIKTILKKLQFLDSDEELDLEALLVWVFLGITGIRALFANLTITLGHDIKWTIQDINLASTLPMLYSILSNSHRRYLSSKTGVTDGQSTTATSIVVTTANPNTPTISPSGTTQPSNDNDNDS